MTRKTSPQRLDKRRGPQRAERRGKSGRFSINPKTTVAHAKFANKFKRIASYYVASQKVVVGDNAGLPTALSP
jgi:hypothetical protein